ncbi:MULTISPECIES: flagellar hook protein FlgE [Gammaproteobacteria]|uniref:flagellar hook protein FlgE n=1 Tax=Gammaproteobacteria TaxID=1236 RepID=UPI000DD03CE9|nr:MULTISPECIES: flagellar hook protein FlgE [Gammaproteobacteria]RTE86162.1 flagellar hook protein FlgE [Aliidiomarina sp. B3213]TCZ91513.1 flagellar hook protein FlgE [Lysobacter sp. N42]
MSFNIALSGMAASQKDLDVTANNIANVKTTGFKQSRAEFADVYASSIFSNNRTKAGDGALTSQVAQQFAQGTLNFTENALDMAIKGNGFFATSPSITSQDLSYTRAGNFKLNPNNFIVDNEGNFLQTFPVDRRSGDTTSVAVSTMQPVRIPDVAGAPSETSNIYTAMNVDARVTPIVETAPGASNFDPSVPSTYHSSTSTTVYDSLGESHIVNMYFVKRDPNTWDVYATFDGQQVDLNTPDPSATSAAGNVGTRITFDASGNPVITPPAVSFPPVDFDMTPALLANGADTSQNIQINFQNETGTTVPSQYASNFEVTSLDQDGTTVGRLTSVEVDASGQIAAAYSNGDTQFLGRVALVNFANEQGLEQIGSTKWRETLDSGTAIAGEANSGVYGAIESSALENSNVNLTQELVDMIIAQKNFQANSRALEVNSQLQQTVLQVR